MLSIIIPTLNEEHYLPLLLKLIKKQTIGDYEIVVADAGSKDKTREIARSFGCKVVPGGLPAKGRNQGAAAAKGNLFLFIDAEAVISEDFLEKALQEFEKRNLDVASCALEIITKYRIPKIAQAVFYNLPARILESVFPYASSFILVRREIHQQIGGFDESIKIAEDHAYARKASKIGKFGFLRSVKQGLFPRRYLHEGELNTCWKYVLCNLYNVFVGDVRTDILNYRFGQYKTGKEEILKTQKGCLGGYKFIFRPHWLLPFLSLVIVSFLSWVAIILFFTPKLIGVKVRRLFVSS